MALLGCCQCGGVRFEVPDDFEARTFCHCTTCKKLSGGVGTANGRVRSNEATILQGEELLHLSARGGFGQDLLLGLRL